VRAYHWEVGRETTALFEVLNLEDPAYHWEVGRETTAHRPQRQIHAGAYHWEVGRETTAWDSWARWIDQAYHWEVGRETTAGQVKTAPAQLAYHWEVGRETTACSTAAPARRGAYHWEVGRETTAPATVHRSPHEAYHWEVGRETTAPVEVIQWMSSGALIDSRLSTQADRRDRQTNLTLLREARRTHLHSLPQVNICNHGRMRSALCCLSSATQHFACKRQPERNHNHPPAWRTACVCGWLRGYGPSLSLLSSMP
jgi:hypothetical protein